MRVVPCFAENSCIGKRVPLKFFVLEIQVTMRTFSWIWCSACVPFYRTRATFNDFLVCCSFQGQEPTNNSRDNIAPLMWQNFLTNFFKDEVSYCDSNLWTFREFLDTMKDQSSLKMLTRAKNHCEGHSVCLSLFLYRIFHSKDEFELLRVYC